MSDGCTPAASAAVAGVVVMSANKGIDPKPKADPNKNPCEGQKPYHAGPGDNYFSNTACFKDSVTQTLEQAGANVTRGFKGKMDAGDRVPITKEYSEEGLCPVNVHWHLGAEHLSVGQYDEAGKGPARRRELAATGTERLGGRCHQRRCFSVRCCRRALVPRLCFCRHLVLLLHRCGARRGEIRVVRHS